MGRAKTCGDNTILSMFANACCRPQTNDREEGLKKYNIVNERKYNIDIERNTILSMKEIQY